MADDLSRADRMRAAITRAFAPSIMLIRDDSADHIGHTGSHSSGETHYHVTIVSTAFEGRSRLNRSRAVYAVLEEELKPINGVGLHALGLTLRSPKEHAEES